MTNSLSRLHKTMTYTSTTKLESQICTGVQFTIRRMTLGRRLEMIRQVRDRAKRLTFHIAGDSLEDSMNTSLLVSEIEELYLEWGLVAIEGLQIDGLTADRSLLVSSGPELLCKEIIAAIKAEVFLSEAERKN